MELFFFLIMNNSPLLNFCRRFVASFFICLVFSMPMLAQRNEILSPDIASLESIVGNDWTAPVPIMQLDSEEGINISFDELSHSYHRYSYSIQHCEADWTPSTQLIESDYIDGFARENTIDDYEQSINTNVAYTHYTLTLPNEKCRIKLSGNYVVNVYDEDNNNQPVLKICFMVVETGMKVSMSCSSNTDIDINDRHQQIGMSITYDGLRVTSPATQIKTIVMQNGRWDNAVVNAIPQYVRADGLTWDHCRDLIFPAGNEYRKFELLDPTHTTMGLERTGWDGKHYQAWVFTDEPRPSYVYDEDANGAFCIRNSDDVNNDTESDYIMTHFRLRAPRINGDIFLNGAWTHDSFGPAYRMVYDETDSLYKASVILKQGYYSYQYLLRTSDGTLHPLPSEGSFYQTENSYQALVYFRPQGGRTDRLVGYGALSTR